MRKIVAVAAVLTVVLLGFSITAFAWFQSSLTNSGNTIAAGGYTAELAIYSGSDDVTNGTDPVWTYSGDEYRGTLDLTESGLKAGDPLVVMVSNSGDSTLAFQYRILIASTSGEELAASPQENQENPVLEPGDGAVALQDKVPSDGKITIDFRTAFRANSLTAGTTSASTAAAITTAAPAATTTTTTTAAATTTTTTTAAPAATTTTTTTAAATTTTTTTAAPAVTTTTTAAASAPDSTADAGSTEPSSPANEGLTDAPETASPTAAPGASQAEEG
ncbi:MAG TPA: hypothetical protein H9694_04295 [Firmicutes bacterium]|nr:hypothetical protein [Bacillota bacterium]